MVGVFKGLPRVQLPVQRPFVPVSFPPVPTHRRHLVIMDIMLALIAVLSLVILVGLVRRLISKNVNLPPGPPGYPLIGNIFDIPRQYAWLAFTQWGQLYGQYAHNDSFES
jgi:hypothetical protein